MKQYQLNFLLISMLAMFSSCQAIADIFKAGMWTGILLVVVVVGFIIYLIGKSKKQ